MHIDDEPVWAGPDLAVALDRHSRAPLYEQLEQALRRRIRSGQLAPETRIPSSRALAAELGVSRGVVLEAYAQLTAEGYLVSNQGAPTRVAPMPEGVERPPIPAGSLGQRYALHFDPGLPDLATFPREQWLRSIRIAVRSSRLDVMGHVDPRGAPELRDELMAYLGRVRGAAAEPEHTLICAGFADGFATLCRTLRDRGLERLAVEEPGSSRHRLIAAAAGLEPVHVGVDAHGIDVGELGRSRCDAVVVTPAHQFPTGVVLGAERRAELLGWAEDEDALIVEDDYDSELRYDRVAVGALQGLAPERVCQIGSASNRLAPAVRLGWLLSPSWLTGALTFEQGLRGGGPAVLDQLAFADFLARGELERHLRRMRLLYRSRRDALVAALAKLVSGASVLGIPAGLFAPVALAGESAEDADAVVSAAAQRDVGVEALSWPAHSSPIAATDRRRDSARTGLVLGFAGLPEPAIERGVAVLADAIASARASRAGSAALPGDHG